MSDSNVITPPQEEQEAAIAEPTAAPSEESAVPEQAAGASEVEAAVAPEPARDEAATPDAGAAPLEAGASDAEPETEASPRAAEPVAGAESPEAAAQASAPEASAREASAPEASAPEASAPAGPGAGGDAVARLRRARDEHRPMRGRVFGWNPGGFHVVIEGLAAFVPRSEMELDPIADPQSYVDKEFDFGILKIQGRGKRVVLSRTALLREEQEKEASATRQRLRSGAVVKGRVASLTDFGAFVDLGGGVEGLVHVSEISQKRVAKPADALQVGQEVDVKVLRVEKGGRRVSLSMKALEPDPWRDVKERFAEGAVVTGKVEKTAAPGAFIELEPGLVGLLPTSEMGLPREAIPARAYPPGKEVRVQVVQVDPRRKRISLAPEGSRVEGTKSDYAAYVKQQSRQDEAKFTPFAAALEKLKRR